MKIAVIGATGKVAQHVVALALEQGYEVSALARSPENIEASGERLTTFQGDVREPKSLEPAIEGAELVLSCIGNRSKDKALGPVIALGTQNILDVMKQKGAPRMALISSVGVGDSRRQLGQLGIPGWIFGAMFFTIMNKLRLDLLDAEQRALQSGLDAVVVRPVALTAKPGVGRWIAGDAQTRLGGRISRQDVAAFLVSLAEDRSFDGKAVSLGGAL